MQMPQILQPLTALAPAPVAAALSPAGGAHPAGALVGFSVQHQQQTNWCWAAVSTSVAAFFGTAVWTQCKVAEAELHRDCCGNEGPVTGAKGCNNPWSLDAPLKRVGHFDRLTALAETFAVVQSEIDHGRPLCARIAWVGGNGTAHFVALGGWSIDSNGTAFVDVYDPYSGLVQTTYGNFVAAYAQPGDTWTHSYFTVLSQSLLGGAAAPIASSPLAP